MKLFWEMWLGNWMKKEQMLLGAPFGRSEHQKRSLYLQKMVFAAV